MSNSSTKRNYEDGSKYIGSSQSIIMSKSFNQIFQHRILKHFLFWIVFLLVTSYHGSLFGGAFRDNLINMLILCPVQMIVSYVLVYYQVPKLLFQKRILFFIIHLSVVAYTASALARLLVIYVVEPIIGRNGVDESLWQVITDPIYLLQVYVFVLYIPAVILFLIKMTSEKFKQERQVQRLQNEKRSMELNFLKAQMNPHFLFNTLNNVYALSKEGAKETPEMIMKLSNLLDYTIYNCQEERVSLVKEWELIENYTDLQSMRYKEPLDIVLDSYIENEEVQIAPLILITLVENAFKYSMQMNAPMVHIRLRADDNMICFNVLNSKLSQVTNQSIEEEKKIGVRNLTGQLELNYPGKYKMEVDNGKLQYEVKLNIEI